MKRSIWIILLLFVVVACGQNDAATPASEANDSTAETIDVEATAVAYTSGGRTENGTFFRGEADAPVTLIDYSDFL